VTSLPPTQFPAAPSQQAPPSGDDDSHRQSRERLELALTASRLGVWEWRLDSGEVLYSDRAREIFGFDPDQRLTIDDIVAAIHQEDRAAVTDRLGAIHAPGFQDQQRNEFRIVTPSGDTRNIVAVGKMVMADDGDGPRPIRHVGTLADVTEQRRLEAELEQSNVILRVAIDGARLAVWQFDLAKRHIRLTPSLKKVLGYDPEAEVDIEDVRRRYHREDIEKAFAAGRAAIAAGEPHFEAEFRFASPNGAERWLQMRAEVGLDDQGQMASVIGVVFDVTQRKQVEERLHLLAREVDHRANNLLAVVQGVVSLSRGDTAEALREVILGRVAALARAHQLLSESRWAGADLRRLVEEELRPFTLGDAGRVRSDGPSLPVSPPAAQSIELATNAVKHGALAGPQGTLAVTWRRTGDEEIEITWQEQAHLDSASPRGQGLGLSVVAGALKQIGGRCAFDWRPSGLFCQMVVPGGAGASAGPEEAAAPGQGSDLAR
jgi:PAS domain S-box-containing protein